MSNTIVEISKNREFYFRKCSKIWYVATKNPNHGYSVGDSIKVNSRNGKVFKKKLGKYIRYYKKNYLYEL